MRGTRTLFTSLFTEYQTNVQTATPPERKGRSEILISKRNELLICRYFYYVKIVGKKYPAALSALEAEFFIATRTMIDLLNEQSALLKKLNEQRPSAKELQERFPAFNWTVTKSY